MARIADTLRTQDCLTREALAKLIRQSNHGLKDVGEHLSKKKVLAYYLSQRQERSEAWLSWDIDPVLDERMIRALQVKPRRTASGVATITVVTKPAPCQSNCLYCPNDIRMPKSYLSDEPACQRAERNYFDPYLQVVSRLKALTEMGHATDKVELIILGGSWSDYDSAYQIWFVKELFRALNDGQCARLAAEDIRESYRQIGVEHDPDLLVAQVNDVQNRIYQGSLSYNEAFEKVYRGSSAWQRLRQLQCARIDELHQEHLRNEAAQHRVVGLVVETRPDTISIEALKLLRQLGCTKVQIGVQSLNEKVIEANQRATTAAEVRRAFALLRLFGFKIHAHYMLNLYGSDERLDREGYHEFLYDPAYIPDEVKLYPCVLVEGTSLEKKYQSRQWKPYEDEVLVPLLADLVLDTPEYSRISRMIRDISAHDIKAGSKKTNLRQRVEVHVASTGKLVREIRMREVSTNSTDAEELKLVECAYQTAVSTEHFLQWVTENGSIAGFLRLSLPLKDAIERYGGDALPIACGEAMIREVHVYGRAARLHAAGTGPQHKGLGKKLVERAFEIASEHGCSHLNVISAVGTREYYRNLGFRDAGLYLKAEVHTR